MNHQVVKSLPLDVKTQALNQKGYSIIELSIALAIISIILVTSLAGVQRVLRSNNVNNDVKNINLAVASLTSLSATQTTTTGITMANLIGLKVFEGFSVDAVGGTVKNAFGGQIVVAPNTGAVDGYPVGSGFILYSTNIAADACPDYINSIATLSPNISTANGANPATKGALLGTAVKTDGGPYTLATLSAACAGSAAGNNKIAIAAFVGKT
jgi:prepilin-type N-terminal cleavage/methylation domain-containing protein